MIHLFTCVRCPGYLMISAEILLELCFPALSPSYSCALTHSVVSDSATPWTVACQDLCPWDFPGRNTGEGCHSLLQGIFLTWGENTHLLCLLHWQVDSLPLCYLGNSSYSWSGSKSIWIWDVLICILGLRSQTVWQDINLARSIPVTL